MARVLRIQWGVGGPRYAARGRELARAAQDIATETGLEHRPVTDGQHVAGIYRRSVILASGRYAMLDDGLGFSLGSGVQ